MTQTEESQIPTLSSDHSIQRIGSKGCGLTTPQILSSSSFSITRFILRNFFSHIFYTKK